MRPPSPYAPPPHTGYPLPPRRGTPPPTLLSRGWSFLLRVVRRLIIFAVLMLALGLAIRGCEALRNTDADGPAPSPAAPPCPSAAASRLPHSEDAVLVADYRTSNKVITLCREDSGKLYYYGAFKGRPSTGMVFPATRTSSGFVAHNGAYTYRISGHEVTVDLNSRRVGTEHLTPEPHAS